MHINFQKNPHFSKNAIWCCTDIVHKTYLIVVRVFITFKFTFMWSDEKIPVIFIEYGFCDVRPETTATTTVSVENFPRFALRVTPKQVQYLQKDAVKTLKENIIKIWSKWNEARCVHFSCDSQCEYKTASWIYFIIYFLESENVWCW